MPQPVTQLAHWPYSDLHKVGIGRKACEQAALGTNRIAGGLASLGFSLARTPTKVAPALKPKGVKT